jgi:hypothetical protein
MIAKAVVLELERLRGLRVVADPAALDGARWDGEPSRPTVLRFAPDEAFALGALRVEVDDGHAIVEDESGFVGCWLTQAELDGIVVPRTEWPLPLQRTALAQGLIAGVAAKLWLPEGGGALLLTAAPLADELRARLR